MLDAEKSPTTLKHIKSEDETNDQMPKLSLKQTCVLVPGYPLTEDMYDHQMSQLARIGFRTISLQLYGFSQIKSTIDMYSYHLISRDVSAISNYLDLNAVKLQGRTVGGAVAIHYAVINNSCLNNRLALFAAPAISSSIPTGNFSSTDEAYFWNGIEAIDGLLPSSPRVLDLSLAQSETLINVGVATWFLYQGRHSA